MNFQIIDTTDCIKEIRTTVGARRMIHLLTLGKWVSLTNVVFGGLATILVAPLMVDSYLAYIWYGFLASFSGFLWFITFRPKLSIVNLPPEELNRYFLLYISGIALLWVIYVWYIGLAIQPDSSQLFMAIQVQVFCALNCAFFLLHSRRMTLWFYFLTMASPLLLFITLAVFESGTNLWKNEANYYWLMALLQMLYFIVFAFSVKHLIAELASTVRLRTLYEISNTRLIQINQELKSESHTDYLTGVSNRRAYDAGVTREWSRCVRSGASITIMVFDIDYFKLYNDRYGHLSGDRALRAVADVIRQNFRRPGDLVARYGGEEFVATVIDTTMENCLLLAERVRTEIREASLMNEDSPIDKIVTISVGIAQCKPHKKISIQKLFNLADAALYQAKEKGRDRIESCQDSSHPSFADDREKLTQQAEAKPPVVEEGEPSPPPSETESE